MKEEEEEEEEEKCEEEKGEGETEEEEEDDVLSADLLWISRPRSPPASMSLRPKRAPRAPRSGMSAAFGSLFPEICTAEWSSMEPLWQQSATMVNLTPSLRFLKMRRRSSSGMTFMSVGQMHSSCTGSGADRGQAMERSRLHRLWL